MALSTIVEMIKNYTLSNLPFLMDKGTKVLQEGKKKVTEYSIKQKISTNYKKIGKIVYDNKIRTNNSNIKRELENIAGFYLDLQNNNNLISKLSI